VKNQISINHKGQQICDACLKPLNELNQDIKDLYDKNEKAFGIACGDCWKVLCSVDTERE